VVLAGDDKQCGSSKKIVFLVSGETNKIIVVSVGGEKQNYQWRQML